MQTQGSLQESDLASLLQTMQSERATGTLTLEDGTDSCSLFFLFGHLFHAVGPVGDGEDVVIRALSWHSAGNYHFDPRAKLPAEETIKSSPAELIAAVEERHRARRGGGGGGVEPRPFARHRRPDDRCRDGRRPHRTRRSGARRIRSPTSGGTPSPGQPASPTVADPAGADSWTPGTAADDSTPAYAPAEFSPVRAAPSLACRPPSPRRPGTGRAPTAPAGELRRPRGRRSAEFRWAAAHPRRPRPVRGPEERLRRLPTPPAHPAQRPPHRLHPAVQRRRRRACCSSATASSSRPRPAVRWLRPRRGGLRHLPSPDGHRRGAHRRRRARQRHGHLGRPAAHRAAAVHRACWPASSTSRLCWSTWPRSSSTARSSSSVAPRRASSCSSRGACWRPTRRSRAAPQTEHRRGRRPGSGATGAHRGAR